MGLLWMSGRRAVLVIGASLLVLAAALTAFAAREWRARSIATVSSGSEPVASADPPAPVAAPEGGEPPVEAPAAAAGAITALQFDVVRVAPDGQAVVAGRAGPGARVTVRTDAEALAEVTAGPDGSFVAFFTAPPSAVPQALNLSAVGEGGASRSAEVVLLLPPASDPGAAPETEAASAPGAEAEDGAAASGATEEPAAEVEVAATAVLRPEGVEIVPGEDAAAATAEGEVTLAGISYGAQGQVVLSGRGPAGARLRAYVDDAFALEGAVDAGGRWQMALADVATGVYRLRIDALGPDGAVTSRVETPFQRDFPNAAATGAVPEGSVVVQPGNNLWTLARIHYGEGVRYTQIFTANREMIRNPDLIYPGQIFVLPEDDSSSVLPEDDAPE